MNCPYCHRPMIGLELVMIGDGPTKYVSGPGFLKGCTGPHVTQPCIVCEKPVIVNAVSPSECFCSDECLDKHNDAA